VSLQTPPKIRELQRKLYVKAKQEPDYFSYGTRLMAYRAVDNYVDRSVRNFLRRRHKMPGRGSRRFPDRVIFEELGVTRLRTLHVGRRA